MFLAYGCGSDDDGLPVGPPPSPTEAAAPSPSPSPPPLFRVAVKGDWGYGSAEQQAVTAAMCGIRETRHFDVVVTTGDNFYRPNGLATDRNYFTPEKCLVEKPGHTWRASWGNHDVPGDSTAKVLGAAARYYNWTIGPAEFFMLDSNRPTDVEQIRWLAEALRASTANWKVAVFHHPPYTAGGHKPNEGVRAQWVPLFREHKVSLVLTGHNHSYEHFVSDGVDYLVSGGGGAPLYPCIRSEPGMRVCRPLHHFVLIEIDERHIKVEAIGVGGRPGEVIESFEVLRAR